MVTSWGKECSLFRCPQNWTSRGCLCHIRRKEASENSCSARPVQAIPCESFRPSDTLYGNFPNTLCCSGKNGTWIQTGLMSHPPPLGIQVWSPIVHPATCLCARDLRTGTTLRALQTSLRRPDSYFLTNARDSRSSASQTVLHVDHFGKGDDRTAPCSPPSLLARTLTCNKAHR